MKKLKTNNYMHVICMSDEEIISKMGKSENNEFKFRNGCS